MLITVSVWGAAMAEPTLFDAHMEEVRSGHSEEPPRFHADPEGGAIAWHPRLNELGTTYPTAVLSIVCPDGFPFAMRVAARAHEAGQGEPATGESDAIGPVSQEIGSHEASEP